MILARTAYLPMATIGRLVLADSSDDDALHTVERPWIPGKAPGGRPFVSCVPDADYDLLRHARPNGDVVLALRNPDAGVYYSAEHVPPEGGRALILIHAANYAEELQGCIAPGLVLTINDNRLMVGNSRAAMRRVMAAFDAGDSKLKIKPVLGTRTEGYA